MQGMLLKMDEWILGLSTPCCNYPALKRSWSISSTAQTLPKHLWSKSGCPFRRFQNVDMKWDEVMKAFKSTTHRPSSVQVPSVHGESTSPRRITNVQNTFRRRNLDGIRWICNVYIYIYVHISYTWLYDSMPSFTPGSIWWSWRKNPMVKGPCRKYDISVFFDETCHLPPHCTLSDLENKKAGLCEAVKSQHQHRWETSSKPLCLWKQAALVTAQQLVSQTTSEVLSHTLYNIIYCLWVSLSGKNFQSEKILYRSNMVPLIWHRHI